MAGTIREHWELSVFNCLADARKEVILKVSSEVGAKLLILNGGQRRDRTADPGLFRAGFVPVTRNEIWLAFLICGVL